MFKLICRVNNKPRIPYNIELLATQVQPVVIGDVAQQVHCPLQVRHSHYNIIIQPVHTIGGDEVSNPQSGLDRPTYFSENIECVFNYLLWIFGCSNNRLSRVL